MANIHFIALYFVLYFFAPTHSAAISSCKGDGVKLNAKDHTSTASKTATSTSGVVFHGYETTPGESSSKLSAPSGLKPHGYGIKQTSPSNKSTASTTYHGYETQPASWTTLRISPHSYAYEPKSGGSLNQSTSSSKIHGYIYTPTGSSTLSSNSPTFHNYRYKSSSSSTLYSYGHLPSGSSTLLSYSTIKATSSSTTRSTSSIHLVGSSSSTPSPSSKSSNLPSKKLKSSSKTSSTLSKTISLSRNSYSVSSKTLTLPSQSSSTLIKTTSSSNKISSTPSKTSRKTSSTTSKTLTSASKTSSPTALSSCASSLSYTVVNGDNCEKISQSQNVATGTLIALTPPESCSSLFIGQKLCLPEPCKDHVVVSGDTCSDLATTNKISFAELRAFNPFLDAGCTNLILGQNICLSKPGSVESGSSGTSTGTMTPGSKPGSPTIMQPPTTTPPGTTAQCYEYYTVVSGDYCFLVENKTGVTFAQLRSLNPDLREDCSNLLLGEAYCVKGITA